MTTHQKNCFNFIKKFQAKHNMSPTYQEVADFLGCSRQAVQDTLIQLASYNYIRLNENRANRKIIIIKK